MGKIVSSFFMSPDGVVEAPRPMAHAGPQPHLRPGGRVRMPAGFATTSITAGDSTYAVDTARSSTLIRAARPSLARASSGWLHLDRCGAEAHPSTADQLSSSSSSIRSPFDLRHRSKRTSLSIGTVIRRPAAISSSGPPAVVRMRCDQRSAAR